VATINRSDLLTGITGYRLLPALTGCLLVAATLPVISEYTHANTSSLSVPETVPTDSTDNQKAFITGDAPTVAAQPLLLVINKWNSQRVLAHIVANVLQQAGIEINFVPFDSQIQFQALADGRVHFQVAAWEGPMRDAFNHALSRGMVDAGTHTAVAREGWWIADYILEDCPAAATWQGLNECAHLFATPETLPAGRFVGPPLDWGKQYAQLMNALPMNFRVINVDNESQLWTTLQNAYTHREPLVLFNWTPNFTDVMYTGRFVDFPEPAAACETDPSWGPNPDATGDCGDSHSNWLKKAAWGGLKGTHPAAWSILKRVDFNNRQIARAIQLVEVDGLAPTEAARVWTEDNTATVEQWINP
jgi:glycine betaine/proline transport system substrate-binding protein